MTDDARLERLRHWSWLLDQVFRVPGTNVRFGWDAIIGLIPGLGDLSSPAFGVLLVFQAYRMRVPKLVQARMVINAMIDALLGMVPILGNVADIYWRANTWNMRLLERHARPGAAPSRFDVLFVTGFLILLFLAAIAPAVLLAWLVSRLWS